MLAQTARTAEMDSDSLGGGIDDLRRRLEAAGRDPSSVDISFTNTEGGSPADEAFNADLSVVHFVETQKDLSWKALSWQ